MNRLDVRESHPDEMTVAAYLDGRLPAGALDEFEAHLAACDECRRALVLMRGLEELEAEPVPPALLGPRRRGRWAPWAALAAAVILAGLLVLPLEVGTAPGADGLPVFRGATTRGPGLLWPADGAVVRRGELLFRWTPVEGAESYRVRVWSVKSDFLLEFGVREGQTEAGWPEDQPPAPTGELLWRVRALSSRGTLGESRPASFELAD